MDEQISKEPLGTQHFIYTADNCRFTTDTMLLAHFAAPKRGEHCIDVGCGCGLIALLWAVRAQPGRVLALELQPDAAALAARSIKENELEHLVTVKQGDAREYRALLPHQGTDLIACNPPYFTQNAGAKRAGGQRLARHDDTLTLEDLAALARYTLKDGGRLCICFPCERMAEAMRVFSQNGLEPKRLRTVQATAQKAPYLFLLECRKAGKSGLQVEVPLVVATAQGGQTEEVKQMYEI